MVLRVPWRFFLLASASALPFLSFSSFSSARVPAAAAWHNAAPFRGLSHCDSISTLSIPSAPRTDTDLRTKHPPSSHSHKLATATWVSNSDSASLSESANILGISCMTSTGDTTNVSTTPKMRSSTVAPARGRQAVKEWARAVKKALSVPNGSGSTNCCLPNAGIRTNTNSSCVPLSAPLRRALLCEDDLEQLQLQQNEAGTYACDDSKLDSKIDSKHTQSSFRMSMEGENEFILQGYPERPFCKEIARRLFDWNAHVQAELQQQQRQRQQQSLHRTLASERSHAATSSSSPTPILPKRSTFHYFGHRQERIKQQPWWCQNWFCPISSTATPSTLPSASSSTVSWTPHLSTRIKNVRPTSSLDHNMPSHPLLMPATDLGFEEVPDEQLPKLPFPPPSSPKEIAAWLHDAGDAGVLRLLGHRKTVGTATRFPPDADNDTDNDDDVQEESNDKVFLPNHVMPFLPPHPQELLDAAAQPHHPRQTLSLAARARAKHAHRGSEQFFGVAKGTQERQNREAQEILRTMLRTAVWMNIHTFGGCQEEEPVLELRVSSGYGARWKFTKIKDDDDDGGADNSSTASKANQGTTTGTSKEYRMQFRGFLEPQMEDGHLKGWKH